MNYVFATVISGFLWSLFSYYVLSNGLVDGPQAVAAVIGPFTNPLLIGLIPCLMAEFVVDQIKRPKYFMILVLGLMSSALILVIRISQGAEGSGLIGLSEMIYATGMFWGMIMPFVVPYLLLNYFRKIPDKALDTSSPVRSE